ncbi:MAG: redox-sensitive transcriptional activator SoxR [Acidimicrobiales bacterium]
MKSTDLLPIGQVAERTGLAVSAVRFYERFGLLSSQRNEAGHRRFARSTLRRLSFVVFAQRLGYSLEEIKQQLDTVPLDAAPSDSDWERLSTRFGAELDERIAGLQLLRSKLAGCIGCGCLSLQHCQIYNFDDEAHELGSGPRWLLGDEPAEHQSSR